MGLFAGIVLAEVIAIFIASCFTSQAYDSITYPKEIAGSNWRVALYMYRGSLLVVMYIAFLALNTHKAHWETAKIGNCGDSTE